MTDHSPIGLMGESIVTEDTLSTGNNSQNTLEKPKQNKKIQFSFRSYLPKLITLIILILALITIYIALNLYSKGSQDQSLKNQPIELVENKPSSSPQTQNEYQKSVDEFSKNFVSIEPFKEKLKPPTVNLNIVF